MKPFTVAALRDYHTLWSTFPGCSLGSLLRSAFARRYLRSRCCFPFLQLLRCFSSLRSLCRPYTFRPESPIGGVAPFGDPRITAWLPAPLGLSQVPTSFIASRYQGIHHVPFQAWPCQPNPLGESSSDSQGAEACHAGLASSSDRARTHVSCARTAMLFSSLFSVFACPTDEPDPGRQGLKPGNLRPAVHNRTRDHRLHLSKSHHFGKRWIGDDRQTRWTVKGVDQEAPAESCTFYYWTRAFPEMAVEAARASRLTPHCKPAIGSHLQHVRGKAGLGSMAGTLDRSDIRPPGTRWLAHARADTCPPPHTRCQGAGALAGKAPGSAAPHQSRRLSVRARPRRRARHQDRRQPEEPAESHPQERPRAPSVRR